MNTPTPTPRTDAATYPADCLGKTLVTNRDCSRALERELVTLTAAYTCTHHTDQKRAACPVCLVTALTAECDQLRSDCENETKWAAHYLANAIAVKAERDQLRAQLHALTLICGTNDANKFETWVDRANARAERAEAELATERARLDWLLLDNLTRLDNSISHRTAIDAAMKEGA